MNCGLLFAKHNIVLTYTLAYPEITQSLKSQAPQSVIRRALGHIYLQNTLLKPRFKNSLSI